MTPQELRNSIIKKALEGKLVDNIQDNFELAEVLKKARLKNKSQPIIDNEIEIEHPDNWIDFRIAEIFDIRNGFTPLRTNDDFWKDGTVNWFTVDDIHNQGRYITDTKVKINSCACSNDRIAPSNSLFICCTASVGEYALSKIPMTSNQQFNALTVKKEFNSFIDMEFFLAIAPFFKDRLLRIAGKTTFPFISVKKLGNLVFSVPCVEEQKCIVVKIKELMPLVDRYEKAWSKLETFNEKFPADMEKSLLLYAVSGKLTSRFKNDGNARDIILKTKEKRNDLYKKGIVKKAKQYPEIASDEIPFEIPSTWVWCRVSDICYQIFAGGDKPSDFTQTKDEKRTIPVVANGITNDGIMGYTRFSTAKKNTITVAGRGTIGFSVYRNYDYCPIVRLIVLEQSDYINPKYLQFALNALPETGLGTSIPQLTVPMLAPKLIPLPPLEEQNRIVDKLEELLPLCRKLAK